MHAPIGLSDPFLRHPSFFKPMVYVSTYRAGEPHVGLPAEYDSLPHEAARRA